MVSIDKITDFSELELYNLCYVTDNFAYIISDNDKRDIFLWFTDNPMTVDYKSKNISIDREFYVLRIKDYMSVEMSGIESNDYQRDGWIDANILYRGSQFITPQLINKGVGCWFYNEDNDNIICSVDTIQDVLNYFNKYDNEIYKIYES
jgi:hypothetical protein